MLLRPDGEGSVLAMGQASHAWISGQLARAWGNARFAAPEPFEEVCLGAEQHDVGMTLWDLEPQRHPGTGLPRQFFEMDRRTHLALWTEAPRRMLTQSRYAALLVSLHGTGLYERVLPDTPDPDVAAAIQAYLDGQRALQAGLAAEVGADPAQLRRNQALVAVWDELSLVLCRRVGAHTVGGVPIRGDARTDIAVHDRGDHVVLDPWPLGPPELTVQAEGRRLTGTFADDAALQAALAGAAHVAVRITLRPAEGSPDAPSG
ncbi:DUF3891 family protein [Baekduia soli]|uniref:DUF3891 family protein n=1 Tax=Baekduia soli TaxID=496014 RepID=A0A5B8U3I7_9ACTN|nr:DUF3891 family protein [Baekduia soli]QEC47597.1 DUF3891 family protein [Baekduia soli]